MPRSRKVVSLQTRHNTKAETEARRREETMVALPSDQLVSPPSYLKGKEARREWRRVVPLLEQIGVFGNLDKSNLAAYCYNYGEWVELIRAAARRLWSAWLAAAVSAPVPETPVAA